MEKNMIDLKPISFVHEYLEKTKSEGWVSENTNSSSSTKQFFVTRALVTIVALESIFYVGIIYNVLLASTKYLAFAFCEHMAEQDILFDKHKSIYYQEAILHIKSGIFDGAICFSHVSIFITAIVYGLVPNVIFFLDKTIQNHVIQPKSINTVELQQIANQSSTFRQLLDKSVEILAK